MVWLQPEEVRALTLSTFAGLSTTIGAGIAIVKRPDDSLLSFLLGTAIGVMATLSLLEMWLHNAFENGFWQITLATALGALFFRMLDPLIPNFAFDEEEEDSKVKEKLVKAAAGANAPEGSTGGVGAGEEAAGAAPDGVVLRGKSGSTRKSGARPTSTSVAPPSPKSKADSSAGRTSLKPGELLRLGMLMAITMTLHNMPEGFAVAFSAFTDFGVVMAVAIAVHNIPEGVIVAAPVYAATGSRWKALAIATASGLSEPFGALIALLFVKPFLTPLRLHYMLAFVGGIMTAVCVLELWPEAKKCRHDKRLMQGVILGSVIMGWTLYAGV